METIMDGLHRSSARRLFEGFVADVTDDLVRTGYLMTWDLAEAEDLVQETLLRVARRWPRVRAMEHPRAYARKILVNLVIDGSRGRARRQEELGVEGDAVGDTEDEQAAVMLRGIDLASEFRWALGTLARQQRVVIVLRYWEDLSEAEVADVLGCSVGTVKSTAWRGLARLRAVLAAASSSKSTISTASHERGTAS
jgi:RNA polymerase sigma-70 factor (sigma-E family)